MVIATASKAWSAAARNWNSVPSGMLRLMPGTRGVTSSRVASRRHISPRPATTYQSSSTVRCVTAMETSPGFSLKCAMVPPAARTSSRTSAPSGASTSGASGSARVSKLMPPAPP